MTPSHHHPLEGRLTVRVVDKQGNTLRRIVQKNAIVNTGRVLAGQLLVGEADAFPISHLAVGTDATPPAAEDQGLGSEIESIDRAPIEAQALADVIGLRVSAQVSSETNQAVAEAGLFNAGDHGAGVMYNRVVFSTPVPVGTDLDLIFEWDITF
jgi:hypothetical protein